MFDLIIIGAGPAGITASVYAAGEGAKAAFDGLFVITQIAKDGQGKGFTHMKLFTDQINRLANIASPFERFADAFGKMSRDMKVFAENLFDSPDSTSLWQL